MEAPVGYRVFVGGISWKADEVQLEKFFSTHGQVLECKIIMDKATGKSKGYGFVTFKDANSAEFVKQTANFSFLGKNMNVGDAVRKASEPNGANYNGSRPHGNYNNGFHQPYYTPNYYNRQADTQYYGQFSPDGSFYPAQFYYPQGYRGAPQYQFNYQGFPPSEGDSSASPGDSTSASPPSFASSNYTPYTPNGNAPNFAPYYNNNNYYNAYYYPYAAAGGAYPPGYGYNQGFAPVEGGGGDETGGAPSGDHHTPPHDAHPPHDTTVHSTTDGSHDAVPPTPTSTALPPSTPTSSSLPDSTPPSMTTPASASSDITSPTSTTAPLPKTDGIIATSGSPAQTRTQGSPTRASPIPQHKQQPQQYQQPQQQQQPKQKQRPKSPSLRSASQDPALHSHVIPNFSKLSVSSN